MKLRPSSKRQAKTIAKSIKRYRKASRKRRRKLAVTARIGVTPADSAGAAEVREVQLR